MNNYFGFHYNGKSNSGQFRVTNRTIKILSNLLLLTISLFTFLACSEDSSAINRQESSTNLIIEIRNEKDFNQLLKRSNEKLMAIELYAQWCDPCHVLEPILRKIAKEYESKVSFYKIDVDQHRELAFDLGMRGIPYVVFFKNETIVGKLQGLRPKEDYITMIKRL